jgi:PAS domain S-box-containing protein
MKRIAVLCRPGHELDDEAEACLVALNRAGISTHIGKPEEQYNIIWVKEDLVLERALALLRACSFEVMERPNLGEHIASKVPVVITHVAMSPSQEEDLLLSIVENSMDAIVSADGVIDKWNPAATKLYGYTATEAIGKPATLIVPLDKLDEFQQMKAKLELGERIEQFDTQRMRKDGSLVDVAITVFPILDSAGKLIATSVISHDMTEQLAHMKEANRIIEKAGQLKTDFLAKMSHEIRTPLNSIIGTSELQMLTELTPQQRRQSGIIQASGELLLSIVNDILDFSKISADKLVLEEIDFNFIETVEGIVDTFAAIVHAKGLELALSLDPKIPAGVRADPTRIRQILNNLLSNALKFTPEGEVLLRVTLLEANDSDLSLRFEVKDTGIGMTREVQSRLFQPFVQAEESVNRRYGGTGLGLVISAQLVEQMGGKIEVESAPGKGTSFRFALHLKKGAEILRPWLIDSIPEVFKTTRALIVDDSTFNRQVLSEYLTSWTIANLAVASSAVALKELRLAAERNLNYKVVLLDEGLPGTSGLALAQIIRKDSLISDTRLIIMSADPDTKGSAGNVDSWLVKPIRPSLLFNCLHNLLSGDPNLPNSNIQIAPVVSDEARTQKGARVLVVEDNPTNQTLAKAQLGVLGYQVEIVGDAVQALDAMSRSRYDIVLMDCELPGMDGYEATTEIRRREGDAHHTAVIALTAHATEADRSRCLEAGMDGYLTKPTKLQVLADMLDLWCGKTAVSLSTS